jgi:hypothetical protein
MNKTAVYLYIDSQQIPFTVYTNPQRDIYVAKLSKEYEEGGSMKIRLIFSDNHPRCATFTCSHQSSSLVGSHLIDFNELLTENIYDVITIKIIKTDSIYMCCRYADISSHGGTFEPEHDYDDEERMQDYDTENISLVLIK